MGVVYQAKHSTLDRVVAIKMILEGESTDAKGGGDDLRQRFANEVRAAASLDHPGIVPVFEVGQWNQCPYFAMAFIEGPSLASLLREGPLPTQRAAQIAREVADGIGHAHDNQIVHRDLKPANILIDQTDSARVTDFGVSKLLDSASDLTQCGELIGTPHFMPPEQAGGSTESIGPGADVYSIGAVLFAMLTGRPPFQAASPVDVIAQVITQQPVAPSALNSRVPSELEVITLKCLSKRIEDRYTSAHALSSDLSRFLAGEPILAKPPGWIQRGRLFLRKHVLFASVSGSVALLLVLTTVVVFVSLLHARNHINDLSDKLASAEQLIQWERQAVSKFIGDTESSNEHGFFSYEVSRLAASAEHQKELNPDLALQLAIAAIDVSRRKGLQLPKPMLDLISDHLTNSRPENPNGKKPNGEKASQETPDAKENHLETQIPIDPAREATAQTGLPANVDKLLELARQAIARPLSEAEKMLYGITDNEPTNETNETPKGN